MSGMLGTIASIMSNMVPMSFMPEVIETRDVRGINVPLASVNEGNLIIWTTYALLVADPFMSMS